jgi:SAM-dependent methyltransferase
VRSDFKDYFRIGSQLSILEVNEAFNVTPFLAQIPGHLLATYPQIHMQHLPYADASFDLVAHSDTLEHIPDPDRALAECRRVLKPNGVLAYTIPVIVGRMSRSRAGLPPSYHSAPNDGRKRFPRAYRIRR